MVRNRCHEFSRKLKPLTLPDAESNGNSLVVLRPYGIALH